MGLAEDSAAFDAQQQQQQQAAPLGGIAADSAAYDAQHQNNVGQQNAVADSAFNQQVQISAPAYAAQQKAAADQTAAAIGNPSDPNFDTTGLQGWQYKGGLVTGTKRVPGFFKQLDILNTAVDRGVKNFTLGIMSKLPLGKTYQDAIKAVDAASTAEQQKNINTYDTIIPQLGEVGGELLATAPVGGAIRKVVSKAASLGMGEAIMPSLLGDTTVTGVLAPLTKYATSSLGTAGVLGASEALRYDPNNPEAFNTKAAGNVFSNPASYILGPVSSLASGWAQAANKLGKFTDEFGTSVAPRNLLPDGARKTISQEIAGFLPSLTGVGDQLKSIQNIGDPLWKFIAKGAGYLDAKNPEAVRAQAANLVQKAVTKVKDDNNNLWNQPFKTQIVPNTEGVIADATQALDLLNQNSKAITSLGVNTNQIDKILNKVTNTSSGIVAPSGSSISKGSFTVEDVKNIRSNIGAAISNVKSVAGSNELSQDLKNIKDSLYNHMTEGLSAANKQALEDANQHQIMYENLKNVSPLVEKAMTNQYQSTKLLDKITSEKNVIDKQQILNQIPQQNQNEIAAAKLANYWKAANDSTGFKIDSFLTKVKNDPDLQGMMGTDSYKAFSGVTDYMKSLSDSSKVGWWRTGVMMAAAGIPAALAGAGPGAGVAAVASLGALTYAMNHPHLKLLFNAISKQVPENTKNLLIKAVGNNLLRAGYRVGTDGVLKHKSEDQK